MSYRETHYHCCICRRVFGSAHAFEVHQKAKERRDAPATDAQLARLQLFPSAAHGGAWKERGSYSGRGKSQPTKPPTAGYAGAQRGTAHIGKGGAE